MPANPYTQLIPQMGGGGGGPHSFVDDQPPGQGAVYTGPPAFSRPGQGAGRGPGQGGTLRQPGGGFGERRRNLTDPQRESWNRWAQQQIAEKNMTLTAPEGSFATPRLDRRQLGDRDFHATGYKNQGDYPRNPGNPRSMFPGGFPGIAGNEAFGLVGGGMGGMGGGDMGGFLDFIRQMRQLSQQMGGGGPFSGR